MKIKHVPVTTHSPCAFLTQHATEVLGILSGFDRLRLRASLRSLYQPRIMMDYLSRVSVLLKDFAAFASGWTERVRAAAHQLAEQTGRPVGYLHSSAQRKETLARDLPLPQGKEEALSRAAALVTGWCGHTVTTRVPKLGKRLKRLRQAEPFWRRSAKA